MVGFDHWRDIGYLKILYEAGSVEFSEKFREMSDFHAVTEKYEVLKCERKILLNEKIRLATGKRLYST